MKKIVHALLLIATLISTKSFAQIHYVVTKTTDNYPAQVGELRWAITEANNHVGLDYIDFQIPLTPPITIQLIQSYSILGIDLSPVIIDGNTQPSNGYSGIEPKIHIKGPVSDNQSIKIYSGGSGTEIKNITFSQFGKNPNNGSSSSSIELVGISGGVSDVIIEKCVFYDMGGAAIASAFNCHDNIFRSNYFGTNRAKNLTAAIYRAITFSTSVNSGLEPHDNLIGGTQASDKNYFYNASYNPSNGFPGVVHIGNGNNNKIINNVFVNNSTFNINLHHLGANNQKPSPLITKAEISNSNITIAGTSEPGDYIEIYKSNTIGRDAEYIISTAIADTTGKWTFTVPNGTLAEGDIVTGTATDENNNTSEFIGTAFPINNACTSNCPSGLSYSYSPNPIVLVPGQSLNVTFTNTSSCSSSPSATNWEIKHIASGITNNYSGNTAVHAFNQTGLYRIKLTTTVAGNTCTSYKTLFVTEKLTCENCISSFAPEQGKYILSAWVKEEGATPDILGYTSPELKIYFPTDPNNSSTYGTPLSFTPSGDIIDGWQRIEKEFTIPAATYILIELHALQANCYFDDIRIFPKDASVVSYVYDPVTLKLVAQLDERNYATFFDYDEEGKLVRTKKETEKGVLTIKEVKQNNVKK